MMDVRPMNIVVAARTMLGTPFHHQGRAPGAGVDCIGLIVCTAQILELPLEDRTDYAREPSLDKLMKEIQAQFTKVPEGEHQWGDVLVFWVNPKSKHPQHIAFLTDKGMLHTWAGVGRVVEHHFTDRWRKRLVGIYRLPGVK